jgi:hypothetical protein
MYPRKIKTGKAVWIQIDFCGRIQLLYNLLYFIILRGIDGPLVPIRSLISGARRKRYQNSALHTIQPESCFILLKILRNL